MHNIMKKTRNQYHYQYKKCVKAEDKIRSSKLLSACLGEGGDLFKEIKNLRKCAPVVANSIDGVSDNIPEHFASIYSELYNSADDAEKLREVHIKVESLVEASQSEKVAMITPDLVKKASEKLRVYHGKTPVQQKNAWQTNLSKNQGCTGSGRPRCIHPYHI